MNVRNFLTKQIIKNVKVLVWDVDGTLFRNQEFANKIYESIITFISNELKISLKLAKIKLDDHSDNFKDWGETASFLTKKSELEIILEIEKYYDKSSFTTYDPQLVKLFEYFQHKSYIQIILTNSSKKQTKKLLKKIGLLNDQKLFSYIFTIDNSQHMKPHPKSFQQVINATNLEAKKHLMIGDSLSKDIKPAKKIGMKTCYVYPNKNSRSADLHINNLNDLKYVLS